MPLSLVHPRESAKECSQTHQLEGCPQVVPQRQKQTQKMSCEPHLGNGFITKSPSIQNSNSTIKVICICIYRPAIEKANDWLGKASYLKGGLFLNLKFDSFVSAPPKKKTVSMAEESEFYQNFCVSSLDFYVGNTH